MSTIDAGVTPDLALTSDLAAEDAARTALDAATVECLETEDNLLGPFYRVDAPFRTTLAEASEGEPLFVTGTVRRNDGGSCAVLPNALLDVWQANAAALYDLTDPTFRWRGRLSADTSGRFALQTILPGRYLNGSVYRPRHIHFKVSGDNSVTLITQLYFAGDPFLATDPFQKPSLVIPLTQLSDGWHGQFDITLRASE